MQYRDKFVDFYNYCKKCEYFNVEGHKDPCDECLHHPVNQHSVKPVKFKESEQSKKRRLNNEKRSI